MKSSELAVAAEVYHKTFATPAWPTFGPISSRSTQWLSLPCDNHSLTGLKDCKRNTTVDSMDLAANGLSANAQLGPWLARWLDQVQNAAPSGGRLPR
jgi:hypothetical protein